MSTWRIALAGVLLCVIGVPVLLPVVDLFLHPGALQVWHESARLLQLSRNTLFLIGGTLVFALPLGILGALLLYRSNLPGRGFLKTLAIVTLLIPLPLLTSAWYTCLGSGGMVPWLPRPQGMAGAVFIHALAGLPWVVWLVGNGLRWGEREVEEAALLDAAPCQVLWHITIPRCKCFILLAGLWIGLQAAASIAVTDVMQVRTFAEEVYTPFVFDSETALAQAMALSIPMTILSVLLVVAALHYFERTVPPLEQVSEPLVLIRFGTSRWLVLLVIMTAAALLLGLPLAGLIRKAGLAGSPQSWHWETTLQYLGRALVEDHGLMTDSVLVGMVGGTIAAGLALWASWLSAESRGLGRLVLLLTALAWSVPGPVIGIGLKQTISLMIDGEETLLPHASTGPIRLLLYDGPSFLPLIWVTVIRYFPCALAVLWPVVRMLPREMRESARLDGARPLQEFRHITWPLTASAWLLAALAVAILSLGELSAGKLVATPGSQTFAHRIFDGLHYGVENPVAALCLILMAIVVLVVIVVWLARAIRRKWAVSSNGLAHPSDL